MLPTKGLYTDCKEIDQPNGTHRDARNIILSFFYGAIINEPGFEIATIGYPDTLATPIGVIMFPDSQYVVLSDGINGGKDRIGVVDLNDNYTDIIVDDILGLDINFPIRSSEIDYNYLLQRIIAWTDYNKPPRILNIDSLPFAIDGAKALVNPDDIIELEVFTKFKVPGLTFLVQETSGTLKIANYSFSIAYENNDGTRTAYSLPQGNINIIDDSVSSLIGQIDGGVPGYTTSKAIQVTINNVDTRYDKLVLVGISRTNNLITSYEIKKVDISSTTIVMSFVGTETVVPITLEDVVRYNPLYNKSKAMAQINNVLYHANLEAEPDIDFQPYANDIRIFYNSKFISITDISKSHKSNMPAGFAHGGVFAFYIRLILKNGAGSRDFHIPGRPTYGTELSSSAAATAEGFTAKKFQFEDTTDQAGHVYALDGDTNRVTDMSANSNMGYWENQDEVYPAGFPDFAGQKVRHHVFPTIQHCSRKLYPGNTVYGSSALDLLGIDVTNVIIPPAIIDLVEGWQILYAKRGYNNSNTLGTDILLYGHNSDSNLLVEWSAGGNWDVNARESASQHGSIIRMRTDRLRGHNFELMKDKPQLSSDTLYVDLELKLRHDNLDGYYDAARIAAGGPSVGAAGGNLVGSGTNSGQNPGGIVDYSYTINNTVTQLTTQESKKITDFRYMPPGIIDGLRRTVKNEESFQVIVNNPTITNPIVKAEISISTPSRALTYLFNPPPTTLIGNYEESYLITYRQLKTNVYNNYDQQITVATDTLVFKSGGVIPTQLTKIRGGDHFISQRSFITTSPFNDAGGDDAADYGGGNIVSITRAHITESRYNIGLRYEVTGDIATNYYPKHDPYWLWDHQDAPQQDLVSRTFDTKTPDLNRYGYSGDSNAINDIYQSVIANPSQITTNKFPFRAIRSGYAGTNAQSIRSWKTYLIADKYEANRNKGEIENIAAMDDVLLIHHKHALMRTTGKDRLLLDTTEVFLGTGDIFSQQPKDMIPAKIGYLGCQNIFSCLSFKGGYAWQNQDEGKIYLITSNDIQEISDNGMNIFFLENLKISKTLPNNPFLGQGLITGYDKPNNRLLFTKRGGNPFTLSYSIDFKQWACFHDYLPDYYFFNNNMLFAVSGHKLFRCDSPTKKAVYFDGTTIYPSYLDVVFKQDTKTNILIDNINWTTEIKDQNDILQRKLTFTHLRANTNHQDTGEVVLVPFSQFGVNYNCRALTDHWNFNKVKDSNIDPYKRKTLVGTYAKVRFKYDNHANLDLSQNSLYLYDFDVKASKVEL